MNSLGLKNLSKKRNQIIVVLFVLSLFYTLSIFIAPLTLESGTVSEINGSANQVVNEEKWEELPFYHRVVYYFGDLNCHQMSSRSYHINDNQMPIAGRSTGIFMGLTAGFLTMSFAESAGDFKHTLLGLVDADPDLSENKEWLLLFLFGSLFALPMILDGGLQFMIDYDSFNEFRTFTGVMFGIGFSSFISSMIISS